MRDPSPNPAEPLETQRTWRDNPLAVVILLLLTFVAGGADATTFLFVGDVFVSNQTGTVMLLAMNVGGADVADTTSAAVSIVAFVVGASVGGRMLPRLRTDEWWPARTRAVLVFELLILVACIALSRLADTSPAWIVGLLAFAMGNQAALATRIAMPYLTTGFVTGVIVKSAMESPVGDRSRRWWWYAATPVATIAAGAFVVGVVAVRSVPVAFGLLAVLVAIAWWLSRSPNRMRRVSG